MGWSRAEQIIQAGIDGEHYDGEPHSRLEALLIELINGGGGGGGGTTDYNKLQNLPSINDVILMGNLTDADFNLTDKFNDQDQKDLEDLITEDN